ncbi:putative winged helix-turn-helix DNA-binding domain, leucine-rich repeat domain, L [Medicago truncatula]|uniref:Putative winged helix-turn-helix DNA-binding domain, leucine-rich repeat domain, L n=1 Tax=Medicago truncatula TaxID=3880 RepID=A0A396HIX3_MEDTR|nr:putative winged helix-turn-helix DNA-binding domain, leucine-rich repeat domain, L [Medicago truncatula]
MDLEEYMLCAHYGQCMKYHIGVLVKKSLLKICPRGYVTLHDLIEDMGKEIVRQESPKEPGKRNRLWFYEDIFQVLEGNSGTSQIEIIHLDFALPEEIVEWKGDEFKKMKNLKTLVVKTSFFFNPHVHLPNSLRVLEWHAFPLHEIQSDFLPKNISLCKLPNSGLTSFKLANSLKERVMISSSSSCRQKNYLLTIHFLLFYFYFSLLQMFIGMTVLGLDDSKCLTEITDISGLQNLKEFSFERCNNLLTIHDSIGFLNKLKILNAHKKITIIYDYMDLECFLGYQGYHLLPNQSDKPSPMVSTNVQSLVHRKCNRTDESFPIILKWFANMTHLDLLKSNFTILPECLQEIRWFPPNLKCLSALNCKSSSSSCRNMLLNQVLFFLVFNLIFHSILYICKLTSSL